jgi:hypothetical protein
MRPAIDLSFGQSGVELDYKHGGVT